MAKSIVKTVVTPGKSSKASFPTILVPWMPASVHNGQDSCKISDVQIIVEATEADIEAMNEALGLDITKAEFVLMMARFGVKVE